MERGCPYLYTGSKFRVIWPSVLIIQRGGCNNPPPLRKICLGKTLRRTRVNLTINEIFLICTRGLLLSLVRVDEWMNGSCTPCGIQFKTVFVSQLVRVIRVVIVNMASIMGWATSRVVIKWVVNPVDIGIVRFTAATIDDDGREYCYVFVAWRFALTLAISAANFRFLVPEERRNAHVSA